MKNTEREGVSAVQNIVYRELGWIFREQKVDDFGIDAEIEVADQERPTGKMIAVQIKSGVSYFGAKKKNVFYFDEKHKKYWVKHSLPVIVLLYHPSNEECIWEVISEDTIKQISKNKYNVIISKEKQFGLPTKIKLLILAYSRNISDLAEDIDDLEVDRESVVAMLDDQQKRIFHEARIMIDKKNASSDRVPFEYKREELSDFANAIEWLDTKDEIVVSRQFNELVYCIENFIYSSQLNTFIIVGEAGIGKTTLVKAVMKKSKVNNILFIQPRYYENILDRIRSGYKENDGIRVVIIDGWDELISEKRLNTWYMLVDWLNYHQDIKVIITSRYIDGNIGQGAECVRIHPLSQDDALFFLKSMTGEDFSHEESVLRLINIYNTPLMLKMLVMTARQQGIPLKEATIDNFLLSIISRYSEGESQILESIAFRIIQEEKMTIVINDERYLKQLRQFSELYIEKEEVSFSHKIFYEIYAAKYIFQNLFSEEKIPEEFCTAAWHVFSNNLCSINVLNYVKYFIKHAKIDDSYLNQLNCNFGYMMERGMIYNFFIDTEDVFKAISNVFYTIWHIISYVNRRHYEIFKPDISNIGEANLACLINIFNKVYFSDAYLDFSYIDLSYMKLWRCNLTNMNFRNSKLYHTNFLGSSFAGSDFQKADLSYSNLVAADLRRVNLKGAILTGANVGNCMISEDSLKYIQPYKDTLLHAEKLIVFMNDGTIKHFLDI